MHVVTDFPRPIMDDPDVGIVLSDGCRLSARSLDAQRCGG